LSTLNAPDFQFLPLFSLCFFPFASDTESTHPGHKQPVRLVYGTQKYVDTHAWVGGNAGRVVGDEQDDEDGLTMPQSRADVCEQYDNMDIAQQITIEEDGSAVPYGR